MPSLPEPRSPFTCSIICDSKKLEITWMYMTKRGVMSTVTHHLLEYYGCWKEKVTLTLKGTGLQDIGLSEFQNYMCSLHGGCCGDGVPATSFLQEQWTSFSGCQEHWLLRDTAEYFSRNCPELKGTMFSKVHLPLRSSFHAILVDDPVPVFQSESIFRSILVQCPGRLAETLAVFVSSFNLFCSTLLPSLPSKCCFSNLFHSIKFSACRSSSQSLFPGEPDLR